MPAARFVEQLNTQIGYELAAHNQYLACAVYYDAQTMPQMAAFFYGQALEQVNALLRIARAEGDFASEQFMQWFIKEQVEEVATMSDLLAVVTRNRNDIEDIEEYVAREQSGPADDPTAPREAGS